MYTWEKEKEFKVDECCGCQEDFPPTDLTYDSDGYSGYCCECVDDCTWICPVCKDRCKTGMHEREYHLKGGRKIDICVLCAQGVNETGKGGDLIREQIALL